MSALRDEEEAELPTPTHIECVLAALLVELESDFPGITERVGDRLRALIERSQIARIRGPRASLEARASMLTAVRWIDTVSMVADATHGPPEKRKKGKRKRRI